MQVVVQGRSGRSTLYGDAETYVLMEPGEDEQFVTAEELQEKLKVIIHSISGDVGVCLESFPVSDVVPLCTIFMLADMVARLAG